LNECELFSFSRLEELKREVSILINSTKQITGYVKEQYFGMTLTNENNIYEEINIL
jgi:hypothetical protein